MQVGTHLDFSKCSFIVENDGKYNNYAIHPHHNLDKATFFESALFVAELLREGLPVVLEADRELLASQLIKFACFSAGSGLDYVDDNFYRFSCNSNFIETSRTVQALMVMEDLLRGGYAYECHETIRGRIKVKGFRENYRDLMFIHQSRFKAVITTAHFYEAYGEAIIPEGQYLKVEAADKVTKLESGSMLRFRAIRHFDSTPTQYIRGVDMHCHAVCNFDKDTFYLGRAELEVIFDPSCFGETNDKTAFGFLPLHWITKTTDGPAFNSDD
jgi:hypothetical protein